MVANWRGKLGWPNLPLSLSFQKNLEVDGRTRVWERKKKGGWLAPQSLPPAPPPPPRGDLGLENGPGRDTLAGIHSGGPEEAPIGIKGPR